MHDVLICDPIDDGALQTLADRYTIRELYKSGTPSLEEAVKTADAMVVRSATTVDRDLLDRAADLKIIVRAGTGLDNIDLEACRNRGIRVENTPGANAIAVAELTTGLILSLLRDIPRADQTMKKGEWIKNELNGSEICGRTIGVVGLGRIGKNVIHRLLPFQADIIGTRKNVDQFPQDLPEEEVRLEPLSTLLSESDIVTLHLPYNEQTHHLIDREQFDRMNDHALLIQCARGGIVNEDALVEALNENELQGAALDVFEEEPPPTHHPLRDHSDVILTPHIAASTGESQERVGEGVVESLANFLDG